MTHIKLVTHRRLIYSVPVTLHALHLLPHHTLLHQPLVIGVIEPINSPKQPPSLPPISTRTTQVPTISTRLILIAVICIAVTPGSPVVLCHITFTVYVAAVYVRNRRAAAFVCPAGWTWVEELLVQYWSRNVVVLSGLSRVWARRCR